MTLAHDETARLLERWHDGERDALARLLEEHLPRLHAFVRAKLDHELRELRRDQDSTDLVQTAAAKVLGFLPAFVPEDGEQFQRLLRTFVLNDIRNQLRSPRVLRRSGRKGEYGDSVLDLRPSPRSSHSPDRAAEKAEKQELVRAWVRFAMEFLPEEDRRLCELRAVEELSWDDIAKELELQADTARMRFRRIQPRLANIIRRVKEGALNEVLEESGC